MKPFHDIDARELTPPYEAFLFTRREPYPDGPLVVRPEYVQFQCRKCKRINEYEALCSGISQHFEIPPVNADAFTTDDYFLVVSKKAKNMLESVRGVNVEFFEVASNPNFYIPWPKYQIHAPEDAVVYTPIEPARKEDGPFQIRGRKCRKCGRIRCMTFWREWFFMPEDLTLAGVMVDGNELIISWVASDEVTNAIAAAILTGFKIDYDAFANANHAE